MHESLPAKLRVLRAREGLYLTDAAKKIGIGRDTLAALERGERRPAVPTLRKIADAYGVPVDELLEEELVGAPTAEAPDQGQRRLRPRLTSANPSVTLAQLRELGIPVNASEVGLLNQYIDVHLHPPEGPYATGYVKRDDEPVDPGRVKILLAYILALGILEDAEVEAVREGLHRELVGAPD